MEDNFSTLKPFFDGNAMESRFLAFLFGETSYSGLSFNDKLRVYFELVIFYCTYKLNIINWL